MCCAHIIRLGLCIIKQVCFCFRLSLYLHEAMKTSDILKEIKRIARKTIPKGGQLILYGSRARNEATEDSDWDLLILLDKPEIEQNDYRYVLYPLAAFGWNIGETISPVMYTKDEWKKNSFTPFYKNVKQDGIVLV